MPPSQVTSTLRRPILRFELASISIDDKPNAHKNPQLVLKPQLELAPRRPYTGSRPRVPVWRHFLMVHVKDKADELVKVDLDSFKSDSSSTDVDTALRSSVTCLFSSVSLIFQYPKNTEGAGNGSSSLRVTLQTPPDLDTVLRELSGLGINIEHGHAGRDHGHVSGQATFSSWAPLGRTMSPVYRPVSNPRQLNSSSPPLTTAPGSQTGYPTYLERQSHGTFFQRPPSQPIGPSPNLQQGPRPWSPTVVPSRPATTLGLPGILGEGIYKVSKVGSGSSTRPRVRRTSSILEQQGPRLYTVSRHFDKTLSRADILHSSRARYLGRGLSSSLQPGSPTEYLSRSPSLGAAGTGSPSNPVTGTPAMQPPSRPSSALEGIPINIQHQARLRRLRTTDGSSSPSLASGFVNQEQHSFLSTVAEEKTGSAFSQPLPATRAMGSVDDGFLFSSSPTLLEVPHRQEMEDDWLLHVSRIQHEGLCKASRVWDEFWDKASTEAASVKNAEDLPNVLSKYEGEFKRRWEGVVAATAQKMRDVRAGHVF